MDLVWNLEFFVDYYRKNQRARLDAHMADNGSIASFLSHSERELDSLIDAAQQLLDDLEAKKTPPKKKPFWRK